MRSTFLSGHAARRPGAPVSPQPRSHTSAELVRRFAEREHRFGSYEASYGWALPLGAVLALGLMIAAFRIPYAPERDVQIVEVKQELVTLEEIQQTRQEVLPPAPPRPPVPVEVPNDVVLDDAELELDASLDLNEALVDLRPPLPAPPPAEELEEEEAEIFVAVEDMPQMIGGVARLIQTIVYPEMARKAGVEGTVIVQIIIDEEGVPRDPVILRSASDLLDDAAVEAVMRQRFTPGRQRGRAVKVKLAIPVTFRLRNIAEG